MLEARRLTKTYSSVPAVDDVSFTIAPGQILGYLGPNGSGKSTTVKMLTGLLEPTRGSVWFDGEDIQRDLAAYKARLGYLPEEPNLYPHLTGREYLDLVGSLRSLPDRKVRRKSDALLDLFSLSAHKDAAIGSYSKGMRQKILIIASLLHNPDLLILDEPLSGLDVTSVLMFRKLIQILGAQGKVIFYCSHVLEVVEKLCTHVLILRKGKVVGYGLVSEIRDQARATLEDTFSHLVDEQDAGRLALDIADVIAA